MPLVSIVVVNHNYGRFLREVVASIEAQTYAEVECIIVDDRSTDDSLAVLAEIETRCKATIIRRADNGGQTLASLDGLAVARGAYVIFVDGDDLLLPRCVETHVYAHLSLRKHVGFTSGDMLQVVGAQVAGGQVVVTTGEDFNRFIRSGKGLEPGSLRPFLGLPEDERRFEDTARRLDGRIHLTAPFATHWVWSPTSGNCYRRDALLLFADNPTLAGLRTGTDMYFAIGIGALCGSALIDEPVFAYRVHGGNIYTQRAQLDRTLNFTPGGHGDSNIRARLYLIDHVVARAARFAPNLPLKLNLVALLWTLDRADIDPALPRWARHSRAAQAIARSWDTFAAALGPFPARLLLAHFAWSPRSPARLLATLAYPARSGGGEPPEA